VRPDAQRRGLSVLLKLYQREWCLARGIRLVTWTYDPFMLRNARLNLVRLGAVVPVFLPDFYGKVGGIYGELPSDRFEAHWRLESPAVERAARGETSELPAEEVSSLQLVRSPARRGKEMGSGPFSVTTENGPDPTRPPTRPTRIVLLPFPAGFPAVFRADLAAGVAARRRFGRAAQALFGQGYEAVSVTARDGAPAYVLERRQA
jgi:predicted GNAT superfamily acetyltransferase